jgi:hypothetical protein
VAGLRKTAAGCLTDQAIAAGDDCDICHGLLLRLTDPRLPCRLGSRNDGGTLV